jgi:clan AA aspartic protease
MITGAVRDLDARIELVIRGPGGRENRVEAVVDTGYNSSLSLPPAIVKSLGLIWGDIGRAILADGSECAYDLFEATIIWDRKLIDILVDELDCEPLVGMELLSGYELKVQVRNEGKVTIKRLR